MRVVRFDGAAAFLDAAEGYLAADEARNHLPLAIARTCRDAAGRYPGANYFATVESRGRVVGAALMTPPHQVAVYVPAGAAALLAEDLAAGGFPVPGAHGPVECVNVFAAAWTLPRGLRAVPRRELRSFALERVIPPPPVPGRMRPAEPGDLETAAEYYASFLLDTHPQALSRTPREMAEDAIAAGRLRLWQDGARVVSQAAVSGFSPTGARIGAVYTPPGDRCRGYATSLVAALSAEVLAGGRKHCYLFTDLANPISNSIYPKIGYRPVGDFREWTW